jgi:hypothetical protein
MQAYCFANIIELFRNKKSDRLGRSLERRFEMFKRLILGMYKKLNLFFALLEG